ncbi:glycosyltransferase family 25 protein [Rickettsia conorii]|uniref:glycosyltransferase family 25 protein n=1 Tax=Rickettsia conorii TaxID=781 RepID=UPI00097376D9|nr:glycosyltransferase family 25 protein [Rickettsia conorii]APZ30377.1 glycosyl transferase [Rickettsia conorii subsp. raoultii]
MLFIFLKTYQIGSAPLEEKDIKIFIVNLDRSTDRYNNISKQFDNNNLFYERFSAVDGYNLSITVAGGKRFTGLDVKNNPALLSLDNGYTVLCPSENINYYSDSKILNHTLTAGELGGYCSHREIWFKMVKDNIPYALIIEDDAILNDDFRNKFLTMLKHLPTDWDLIYLSLSHSKNKIFYNIYNNPYLKKIGHGGYFNTTTGY